MNEVIPSTPAPPVAQPHVYGIADAPPAGGADPTPLEAALRRKWTILAFALLGSAATYVLLAHATPRYIATAEVRIDVPQPRIVDENAAVLPDERPTVEAVNTEMAAFASPALAKAAAVSMGLTHLREFQICPPTSLRDRAADLLRQVRGKPTPPAPACDESTDFAAKQLLGRIRISADRGSYVIDVGAAASDPAFAARIANGYARAYIAGQRDLKMKLAVDADTWLSVQLRTLHDQMVAADAAVESYRQSHHLIGLHSQGDAQASDTLNHDALAQASQELGSIDAALAEKRGTVGEVHAALHAGRYDQVAPALQSPVVQSVLERHAELTAKLAQLRSQYGTLYPATVAAAAELARNESQTRVEVNRVAASLDAELGALNSRRATVAARVAALSGTVAGESEANVGLQELQREAASARSVYESSLVRLKQLDAERFLERANADIVAEATPPDVPDFPHKRMMTIGAFLACLGAGAGISFAIEMLSRRFRDAEHVEDEIGLPVVGVFARRRAAPQSIPVDQPYSLEAETLHATLTQLLGNRGTVRGQPALVTLVTSALPGEGKSSFSVALGRAAASVGLNVIVLDCDLRHPSVRPLIAGQTKAVRSPEALDDSLDQEALGDMILRGAETDELSGLRYVTLSDYIENPRGLLTWQALPALLAHLRTRVDLVLLDAPPILAVSDALHLGSMAGRVLLMVDWGTTPRQAVAAAARAFARAGVMVTGVVMSKVDMRRYARTAASHYAGQVNAYLQKAA